MKVKDLIKLLSKLDKNKEIKCRSYYGHNPMEMIINQCGDEYSLIAIKVND